MNTLPTSDYFTLHQLADGVWAAIGKINSPAYSNTGIIDTGDHTLIFDTFNTYRAAEDLRHAAETLTGRQASFVIISHAHSDHWMGNQVFADHANIISTPQIYAEIEEWVEYFKELKRNPAEYHAYVRETEKKFIEANDPFLKEQFAWSVVVARHQYENIPSNKPTLPTQTFDGRMTIHGSKRKIALYTTGIGHTDSDVILSLPEDSIAFIGDLGFFQTHPFLGSSTPDKWVDTLEELAESDIETFIPGHGPVGTQKDLLLLTEYILACKKMVSRTVKSGGSEEDVLQNSPPDFAETWAGFGRFERSMEFLYKLETK